jgi:signal transduction histidine kinase
MRWRLRNQLLIPLLILLVGDAVVSAWTAVASANRARGQIEAQVRDIARTVDRTNYPLTASILQWTKNLSGADYLVVPRDGPPTTTLATTEVALPAPEHVSEDPEALRLGPRVTVDGRDYFCSGIRVRRGSESESTLYILYPEALWRDALWEAIRPSLLLGGFVAVAAVALAVGVGQRLGRRVQELERRTRLIAAGDFSPMPLPARDDEIRDLTRSVNEMAERLAHFQEAVKKSERLRLLGQVSAGLAHQLRNAVTGARLAVQLHARTCAGADAEALDVALRQLALMEANLKRFLDLGNGQGLRREPCLLSAVVGEAVALLRPQCRHAHIDLRWQPPEADCRLSADAGQLGQMLLNVIGNAMEAAGPGGGVEVRLQSDRERAAVIEVVDTGPGPPPEVAERLFEPFVTGKKGGVGLGLAVARQVVEAHGGRIGWQRQDDRTCFRIELPLAEGSPACEAAAGRRPSATDKRTLAGASE